MYKNYKEFLNERDNYLRESQQKSLSTSAKYKPKSRNELRELVRNKTIYLGSIDVSNVKDFSYVFLKADRTDFSGLETWDVSHVTDMCGAFAQCEKFTGEGIENWDVSNVTDMYEMFKDCKNFTGKGLENWDVSRVEDMRYMFECCSKLNVKFLSKWKIGRAVNKFECSGIFRKTGIEKAPANFEKIFKSLGLDPIGQDLNNSMTR